MRPADSWIIINSATQAGPKAREIVWKFINNKWLVLKQRFSGHFLLPNIINVSSQYETLTIIKSILESVCNAHSSSNKLDFKT